MQDAKAEFNEVGVKCLLMSGQLFYSKEEWDLTAQAINQQNRLIISPVTGLYHEVAAGGIVDAVKPALTQAQRKGNMLIALSSHDNPHHDNTNIEKHRGKSRDSLPIIISCSSSHSFLNLSTNARAYFGWHLLPPSVSLKYDMSFYLYTRDCRSQWFHVHDDSASSPQDSSLNDFRTALDVFVTYNLSSNIDEVSGKQTNNLWIISTFFFFFFLVIGVSFQHNNVKNKQKKQTKQKPLL